jgi:hypothetical protein
MYGFEYHLLAPVSGIRGEAALLVFIVAHGGFAQPDATFLLQVVQTDATVFCLPCHCVCQRHVAGHEPTMGVGQFSCVFLTLFGQAFCEFCHLVFLNILSHFFRWIGLFLKMRQPAVRCFLNSSAKVGRACHLQKRMQVLQVLLQANKSDEGKMQARHTLLGGKVCLVWKKG